MSEERGLPYLQEGAADRCVLRADEADGEHHRDAVGTWLHKVHLQQAPTWTAVAAAVSS